MNEFTNAVIGHMIYEKPCTRGALVEDALAAIRAAAGPQPPVEVRWSDAARMSRDYPTLIPYMVDTAEEATRRRVQEQIVREYVLSCLMIRSEYYRGFIV